MDSTKLRTHILERIESESREGMYYHNGKHTAEVLEECEGFIEREALSESDANLLLTAAVLHDIGYLWVNDEHEAKSAEFAKVELPKWGFTSDEIEIICRIILATKIPQSAQTPLEKMMCDADLRYLGTPEFLSKGEHLYKEFLQRGIVKDRIDWDQLQIKFLNAHRFQTDYALKHWEPIKQENLRELIARTGS